MELRQLTRNLISKPSCTQSLQEWLPTTMRINRLTSRRRSNQADRKAAHALGWASLGIGFTELAAAPQVLNLLGVEDTPEHRGIVRVLGKRELLHGAAILANGDDSKLTVGVWSRVAGDVLDSALLGVAAKKTSRPVSFGLVAAMVAAIGVADLVCALKLSNK